MNLSLFKNLEMKATLFTDGMTLDVENPKYSTHAPPLLGPINIFSKVAEYKGSQKSVAFLCTNNEPSKAEMKKVISLQLI